ncbi:hypothetical protein HDV05_008187 [Chytridiales sp. JEL 0842]|nr:hypothetical protein HDV05_008187 [Chytridiales sp. JEL 0842]
MIWNTLISVLVLAALRSSTVDAQSFTVDTSNGRIEDNFGRERIFHGWNAVWKTAPFLPATDSFNPYTSFSEEDVQLLASLGTNAVRLNVAWEGVYPTNGSTVNNTYLNQIKNIISTCERHNIFVIVDFHQDSSTARFCGNGKPLWLARSDATLNFPAPLGNGPLLPGCITGTEPVCTSNAITKAMIDSIGLNSKTIPPYVYDTTGQPNPSNQCWAFYFYQNSLSYAVSRSFQNLYDNTANQTTHFINYWRAVATALKPHANLLGYEIINEPWAGWYPDALSSLSMSELAVKGAPYVLDAMAKYGARQLAPFYEKLMSAIRAVDADKLIFWESVTFDNERPIFFNATPDRVASKSVLSYHYYQSEFEQVNHERFIDARMKDAKRLGNIGTFMTETYWNKGSTTEIDPYLYRVLDYCDLNQQSWTLWNYKLMDNKDGSTRGLFSWGPESAPVLNEDLARLVSRPYAQAVAGNTQYSFYNSTAGTYTLTYNSNPFIVEPTLIYVNTRYHYPNGNFRVSTTPRFGVRIAFNGTTQVMQVFSSYPWSTSITIRISRG